MGIEKPVKAVKTSEGNTPSRSSTQLLDTADSDVEKFLGYPKFAVLGADQSYGKTVLDYLIANHREAVVITATGSTTVQGISTFKSLSDLPDPTHTAVSIALASEDLLEALQEAKALDIPMIWLQPGMQNDTITKYIADNGLAARCIYPESLPQSDTTKSPVGVLKAAAQSVISSTLSNLEEQPCVIKFLSSQGIKAA
ncbi:hypothetical protein C8J56DRAFT_291011 [Mycena floridula]|nr:hypothetical protein C8J56DRAFT_291011 [Mycena floridula]